MRLHWLSFLLLLISHASPATGTEETTGDETPLILLPSYRLQPEDVAVIVNDRDPLSRRIARHYREKRNIPLRNLIHIHIDPDRATIPPTEFRKLRREILALTPDRVQAYVLTWVKPFRVGCMSITTAMAAGFDRSWCSATQCATTRLSPYYNSDALRPWDRYELRPAMSIAARNFRQAKALIDRGVASDGTWPDGTAYLVDTSDRARNVRAALYGRIIKAFSPFLRIKHIARDYIEDRDDVLFYFTGLKSVPKLETLRFLPGAVADHLTSAGGILTGGKQMSVLRWLEAGATGSYGTVVEPCNLPQKFPNPGVLIGWYLRGETLLEAYWKSVAMPGEGIFVGEPLAAPWSGYRVQRKGTGLLVRTHALRPGLYRLLVADTPVGPFEETPGLLQITPGETRFRLPDLGRAVYRLERVQ